MRAPTKKKEPAHFPFRLWLTDLGLSAEDFVREAERRGVHLRVMTVYKWARGAQPRATTRAYLEDKFPGVRF